MKDSQTSLLITQSKYVNIMKPISHTLTVPFMDVEQLVNAGRAVPVNGETPDAIDITGDRRAQLIYTSGTTGNPKGCVSTHSVIEHQTKSLVQAWEYTSSDHILHVLPLHHVHGVINALNCMLYAGGKVTFLQKFDPNEVWKRFVELDDLNVFTAVPTIYARLIKYYNDVPDDQQKDKLRAACRKFRLMMCGSAALPISVLNEWKEISGHILLERYGMTEIGMALSNPLRGERKPGYVGKPLPYVKVKVQPLEGEDEAETECSNQWS
jgi:malonyl-CoA/methylmalonyl-CoA synthetase